MFDGRVLALLCLAVSEATAFVVQNMPAAATSSTLSSTDSRSHVAPCDARPAPASDNGHGRRRSTAVRGKRLTKDDMEERDKRLEEEEAAVAHERKEAGKNLLMYQPNKQADFWGVDRAMNIGEDEIVYSAYRGGTMPAILYLPAFDALSDDVKAERIRAYCAKEDYPFISMDWYGVGKSSGDFSKGTISRWKQDAFTLIKKLLPLASEKVVIVGGGVGGWIATLIAAEMPEKVAGLVGLAADPDFTENLLVRYLPKATLDKIEDDGVAMVTWGRSTYPVSKALLDDGRANLVLQGPTGKLKVSCPVRLVHGLDDEEVPYTVSLDLSRRVVSTEVNLYLVKTANHHLDGYGILDLVIKSLDEVLALYVPPNPYYTDMDLL